MMNFPLLVFAVCLAVLWLSAQAGGYLRRRRPTLDKDHQDDLGVVLAASLTLLALMIGFSFSMAITRYDQRKTCEAEEANAIGTEYARAGLLPPAEATRIRELLRRYLDQRVLFYATRNERRLRQIDASTAQLQNDLWSAVQARAAATPTPVVALSVAGMNDVLNSQGYSQAAWWNRIPSAAWALMAAIAICCNGLFGYSARHAPSEPRLFFLLPLIVSISFFLIADIDSPRGGVILVHPQNLESAARVLMPQ